MNAPASSHLVLVPSYNTGIRRSAVLGVSEHTGRLAREGAKWLIRFSWFTECGVARGIGPTIGVFLRRRATDASLPRCPTTTWIREAFQTLVSARPANRTTLRPSNGKSDS